MHQYTKSCESKDLSKVVEKIASKGYIEIMIIKEQFRDAYTVTATGKERV